MAHRRTLDPSLAILLEPAGKRPVMLLLSDLAGTPLPIARSRLTDLAARGYTDGLEQIPIDCIVDGAEIFDPTPEELAAIRRVM